MFYTVLTGFTLFCGYQLNREKQSQEQYSNNNETIAERIDFMQKPNEQKENDTLEERINVEWRREINDHEDEWMEDINEKILTLMKK